MSRGIPSFRETNTRAGHRIANFQCPCSLITLGFRELYAHRTASANAGLIQSTAAQRNLS